MQEEIRKLYKKLYDENNRALDEKKQKTNIQREKDIKENNNLIIKHFAILIVMFILVFILAYIVFYKILVVFGQNKIVEPSITNILMIVFCALAVSLFVLLEMHNKKITKKCKTKIEMNNLDKERWIEYKDMFCTNIYKPIIEYAIPESQVIPNIGILENDYISMGFNSNHDKYRSSYEISFKNKNYKMSKVYTGSYKSEAGELELKTLFLGIVCSNTLSFDTNTSIKVHNKKLNNEKFIGTIKTNNKEFNRFYEVEAENEDLFVKYFTDEVINYFVECANNNHNVEVNMNGNHIYTRVFDEDFLEVSINDNNDLDNNVEKIINNCNSIITIINTNEFLEEKLKENI